MQVTINIPDALGDKAEAIGLSAERYVEELVAASEPAANGSKVMSAEQLDTFLRQMAAYSDRVPNLGDSALSRETLYSDHD